MRTGLLLAVRDGVLAVSLLVLTAGCAAPAQVPAEHQSQADREHGEQDIGHARRVPQPLRTEIHQVLPHDAAAFTQGLERSGDLLYEGTGQYGRSALTALDPRTAAPRQRAELPAQLFGEGITVAGDRIWQLTWKNGQAIERDRVTLTELRRVPYRGEGWGLCHQSPEEPGAEPGGRLVMSDGSDRLTFRDPSTFAPTGSVRVTRPGGAGELNELECAGGAIWANVYGEDTVLRIDPVSGEVTGQADASGLLTAGQRSSAGVLNGIAAVPGSDEFLLTGKNWPAMFRVRLVPA